MIECKYKVRKALKKERKVNVMKKRNVKFVVAVVSVFMASLLVLASFMYVIASERGEAKQYDLNLQKNFYDCIVENSSPTQQDEMQRKFNVYLHKDEYVLTIFSDEQYAMLKAVRDSNLRDPLTYEEIIYLVNDSINLYFTYDEIRLNNACVDGVLPTRHGLAQGDDSCIIYPYHGSYAECEDLSAARELYGTVLEDIYAIIFYRIYMHDAAFETVLHTEHFGDEMFFGNRFHGDLGMINSAVPLGVHQMMCIDDDKFSGVENEEKLVGEYKKLVEWDEMWSMNTIPDYDPPTLNSPILITSILNTISKPKEYKFHIIDADTGNSVIYPTKELEEMDPDRRESNKEGETQLPNCISYLGNKYALTLPRCKQTIMLNEAQAQYVPYISDILVTVAELRISEKIEDFERFSLYIDENGFLNLRVEIIKDIEPPKSDVQCENFVLSGCGFDHEHIFYSERISSYTIIVQE